MAWWLSTTQQLREISTAFTHDGHLWQRGLQLKPLAATGSSLELMVGSAEQLWWKWGHSALHLGCWQVRWSPPRAVTPGSEGTPIAWSEQGSPREAGVAPWSYGFHGLGLTPNTGGQWERFPVASGRPRGYCQGTWDTLWGAQEEYLGTAQDLWWEGPKVGKGGLRGTSKGNKRDRGIKEAGPVSTGQYACLAMSCTG